MHNIKMLKYLDRLFGTEAGIQGQHCLNNQCQSIFELSTWTRKLIIQSSREPGRYFHLGLLVGTPFYKEISCE